jgi:hypothetical protein
MPAGIIMLNEKLIDPVYLSIWDKAKPLYEQSRPTDIAHIEWFMETATKVSQKEHLDDTVLLPLSILHDIGYSKVKDIQFVDYFKADVRKAHMQIGAQMAKDLLVSLNYPVEKIEKTQWYVGIHDNWALGEVDIYLHDSVLGTFKDLDYLWGYTGIGFLQNRKARNVSDREMLKILQQEISPIGGKKPFSNKTTKDLHDEYLKQREKDFQS